MTGDGQHGRAMRQRPKSRRRAADIGGADIGAGEHGGRGAAQPVEGLAGHGAATAARADAFTSLNIAE